MFKIFHNSILITAVQGQTLLPISNWTISDKNDECPPPLQKHDK
ncbi:hypothetical Protein YC6258_01927 [Gynuella sunshinyii YC6258]|uniref:Uncharacterized protein n=1 Tax=Gynuella sunshinyii YC6258 TaxID=1445510 RepID=A0A0C5VH54_9GAMM|nr:hypothetical Protein YC6258_01927 [Gynuella sunshinyii YC6258]